jgi:hypothetical protein
VKFLLLLGLLLAVLWQWRLARSRRQTQRNGHQRRKAPQAVEMVPCGYCGVHVAASDAFKGAHAAYCSSDHRNAAEH